jgi:GT2 family glycosyltransferase
VHTLPNDPQATMVAIIVVHYSNYEVDTRRCLTSLRSVSTPATEVVVVDNASLDCAPNLIRAEFPEVTVLSMPENLGFSAGNNRGISYALSRGYEYVLLLNNDTEIVDPAFLTKLIDRTRRDAGVGLVGPRVRNGFTGYEQRTVLSEPQFSIADRLRGAQFLGERSGDGEIVVGLSGVCWLVPTRVFEKVGFLDEAFFMYLEDNDFCLRLRQAGFRIELADIDALKHYQKSVLDRRISSFRTRMHHINKVYYVRKHGGSAAYCLLLMAAFFARSVRALIINREGGRWSEARSMASILKAMYSASRDPDGNRVRAIAIGC